MFQITHYANAERSQVLTTTTLESVLETIKNGDNRLPFIHFARTLTKGTEEYSEFKKKNFPTFRFNFLFRDSAANKNIIAPTGLIYIDADEVDAIPESPYILASWKSLSDTGFGILVKVDNLSLANYAEVYDQLSELIGISSDAGARKATQQTIQTYDPNLYHNPDSLVFHFIENDEVSHAPISEKREKCIGTHDTLNWNDDTIRFNNIGSYFTDDTPYILFKEKEWICNPFIPLRIEQGNRNSTMFFLLSQYALLNPNAGKPFLKSVSETINKHMFPRLSEKEITNVIDSIVRKREEGTLTIHYNEPRRILFHPNCGFGAKEKMDIVNKELGKLKSDVTKELIYAALESWDFESEGLITQKKVSVLAGRGIATVKRHWKDFKSDVQAVNEAFIDKETVKTVPTKPQGISVEKYIVNMRCKFTTMDPLDEKFLRKTFKEHGITNAGDDGFDEVHQWMLTHLQNRQQGHRAA